MMTTIQTALPSAPTAGSRPDAPGAEDGFVDALRAEEAGADRGAASGRGAGADRPEAARTGGRTGADRVAARPRPAGDPAGEPADTPAEDAPVVADVGLPGAVVPPVAEPGPRAFSALGAIALSGEGTRSASATVELSAGRPTGEVILPGAPVQTLAGPGAGTVPAADAAGLSGSIGHRGAVAASTDGPDVLPGAGVADGSGTAGTATTPTATGTDQAVPQKVPSATASGAPSATVPTVADVVATAAAATPASAAPSTAATPAPTTTAAAPQSPLPVPQQVATAVSPLLRGPDGTHELTLHLTPEGLGRVRVRVTVAGDEVRMHLTAVEGATRELLRDGLPELRTQLEDAGLKATRLDVQTGSSSSWSGPTPDHSDAPQRDATRATSPRGAAPPPTPGLLPTAPGTDSRLDLRM